MMRNRALAVVAMMALLGAATSSPLIGSDAQAQGRETMRAFSSEAELQTFLRRARGETGRVNQANGSPIPPPPPPPPPGVPAPVTPSPTMDSPTFASEGENDRIIVTGTAAREAAPGITNNQTANVDEGGIVKTHGTHLVILRRGRLFTVDTGGTTGSALRTIDVVDAFPPSDRGGQGAWYDEMLVSGDMVVVIGFNYQRSGTEINRFRISDDGQLTYRDTHHLRSNDYYSSRNYASRLIGSRLVVYAPLQFYNEAGGEIGDSLPGLRRWTRGGPEAGFERLATPRRVFVADMVRRSTNANIDTTHSVTSCDLAAAELDCSATVILGSESRNFYVAQDAVYVWTGDVFSGGQSDDDNEGGLRSMLYRIPLNGTNPQAVGVWGNPTDQFSFRADPGALNVLVRNDEGGDRMWAPETGRGDIALLRLSYADFGNGNRMAPPHRYQPLPGGGALNDLQNRFVGGHLLYAGDVDEQRRPGNTPKPVNWGDVVGPRITVVGLANRVVTQLPTTLSVTRIDQMGRDGMVIGTRDDNGENNLVFQTIDLSGTPRAADSYALTGAREGESRSHAYYYRGDNADGSDGLLGLPVSRTPTNRNSFLNSGSGLFFLNRRSRQLVPAGQLDADDGRVVQDNCLASCTDWYGNARPIFYGPRIFALMGYELVEGRMEQGRIGEIRRLNFAPQLQRQRAN